MVEEKIISLYKAITGNSCYYMTYEDMVGHMQPNSETAYCCAIQRTHDGLYKCCRQRHLAAQDAVATKQAKIFRCHAGLVECIVPVFTGGGVQGFFCCGFLAEDDTRNKLKTQLQYYKERYGIDAEEAARLLDDLATADGTQLQQMAALLSDLVYYFYGVSAADKCNRSVQIPLPEDFYTISSKDRQLKTRKNMVPFSQMLRQAQESNDKNMTKQIWDSLRASIDAFCRSTQEGKTVLAKDQYLSILMPAYLEPDLKWCKYQVVSRLSRISRRLYDYCGYSEKMEQFTVSVSDKIFQAETVREIRLFSNDFYQVAVNDFAMISESRLADNIRQIKDYIDVNCAKNIKVMDVAKHFAINSDYLNRIFKANEGITVKKYITLRQVSLVKEQLENTQWTIEAIAAELNFTDPRSLYRMFRKNVGITCSEYRRIYGKQNHES